MKISYKDILPEYPSLQHLPYKPNNKGDKIATEKEASVIFNLTNVTIQEKIDGANCGMAFIDDYPILRSRTKILKKGQELSTPARAQFGPAWNWMYNKKNSFIILNEFGPYSVYGEWMLQQHGLFYDALPDWFIAYDIYDYEKKEFINSKKANFILNNCGFETISFCNWSGNLTYEKIEELSNKSSSFCSKKREGVIVKVSNDDYVTHKFKMVRQGFEQGSLLGKELKKNKLLQRKKNEK